jgi:hypothetical protein
MSDALTLRLESLEPINANVVVPRSPITTMARLPIIPNDHWHLNHGTEKVSEGALKGETDSNNRLSFPCPQCGTKLSTRLAGVSDDFTEWKPDEPNSDYPPLPMSVFEIKCLNCQLVDHFKILCNQHREFGMRAPLPEAQSRRVSSTTVRPQALIPVVCEEDLDPISEGSCRSLRMETDTDYLCFYGPRPYEINLYNGFRLVAAVLDPESKPKKGNLASISGFQFEWCCGPERGCVGDFVIPVTAQTLRLCAR